MEKELISVIIPAFNAETTIERCIESLQNNTYKKLEIIIVDDGSTDSTGKLCDLIQEKDPRIHVFHKENGGVSMARNFGLTKISGEYIAFVDSDDWVGNTYLEELRKCFLIHQDCELSVGTICNVYGEKKNTVELFDDYIKLNEKTEAMQDAFLYLNKTFLLYGPVNKLYLANIIKQYDICFPEDISYGEDLIFNTRYLENINNISTTGNAIYTYEHSNTVSLSQKYRSDRFENGIRLNRALLSMFSHLDLLTDKVERYIYRRIFDDAYNTIFELWNNDEQHYSFSQKCKRVSDILYYPEFEEACIKADLIGYQEHYVRLMKKKASLRICLIRQVTTFYRKVIYK